MLRRPQLGLCVNSTTLLSSCSKRLSTSPIRRADLRVPEELENSRPGDAPDASARLYDIRSRRGRAAQLGMDTTRERAAHGPADLVARAGLRWVFSGRRAGRRAVGPTFSLHGLGFRGGRRARDRFPACAHPPSPRYETCASNRRPRRALASNGPGDNRLLVKSCGFTVDPWPTRSPSCIPPVARTSLSSARGSPTPSHGSPVPLFESACDDDRCKILNVKRIS